MAPHVFSGANILEGGNSVSVRQRVLSGRGAAGWAAILRAPGRKGTALQLDRVKRPGLPPESIKSSNFNGLAILDDLKSHGRRRIDRANHWKSSICLSLGSNGALSPALGLVQIGRGGAAAGRHRTGVACPPMPAPRPASRGVAQSGPSFCRSLRPHEGQQDHQNAKQARSEKGSGENRRAAAAVSGFSTAIFGKCGAVLARVGVKLGHVCLCDRVKASRLCLVVSRVN